MDLPPYERVMLPNSSIREITGFGMACRADGYVFQPKTVDEIREVLDLARGAKRPVVLRGAGRSYGDAAILAEAVVLDLTQMRRFISWDSVNGVAECEPGVTIEDLWRTGLPNGWWPPVVSGTMFPTLGGALAMNIHGKNCLRAGTLGEHVLDLDFLDAGGKVRTLTPDDELFYRVISSAGLLGIITRVKIQLKAVSTGDLRVFAESVSTWDEQFEAFLRREETADYMVSWVDCFAKGRSAGRGLFHAAWHDTDAPPDSLLEFHQDLPDKTLGILPKKMVWRLLAPLTNRTGIRFLNAMKHHSARFIGNGQMHQQSLVAFNFLLDYVPDWRNAYLPGGFIQYQSFVPRDRAREAFAAQIAMSQDARLEPYLGVMKMHRPDKFLFSHGVDGFSLALDYKVTEQNWPLLQKLCHRMNEVVLECGGRFYLAKDATLRPSDFSLSISSGLEEFRKLKQELDPEGLFRSGLGERLALGGR